MKVGVILSAHENSETYKDTLESVQTYLSDELVLLIDGFGWDQFSGESVDKIEGFKHGKNAAPVRNMALGMMGAWEKWKERVDWYCYIEYDCLVGSKEIKDHLRMADERDYWMLGNDLRHLNYRSEELEQMVGSSSPIDTHYFLGCCVFFSKKFMSELAKREVFGKILHYYNFFPCRFLVSDNKGRPFPMYDPSEMIYPSLALHYGGSIKQLAKWNEYGLVWEENFHHYPMRFTPELSESDPFQSACIMHPVKNPKNPIRSYHRQRRENAKS